MKFLLQKLRFCTPDMTKEVHHGKEETDDP